MNDAGRSSPRFGYGSAETAATFDGYDSDVREHLLVLRELIFDTAENIGEIGPLEETLKWGQPSYLTSECGSGSTIRIAPTGQNSDRDYALFFICSTNLVGTIRSMFGDTFVYDKNRALMFDTGRPIPENELRECIAMALTYHRRSGGRRP